ncbi:MAG: hypothetical protein Q7S86_03205 [bacterium]|nr:hypothetical protein [bacterium]
MSNSKKLTVFIVIVVIILIGLWGGGFLGGSASVVDDTQSAAALSGATETIVAVDFSDAVISQESSAIDAQMKVAGNQFATFSQASTAAKADLLSIQLGNVASLISKLSDRFKARIANLKTAGFNTNALQGAFSSMALNISYARSQAGLGGQLAAKAKAEGVKNVTTLQQAVIELQKAQTYLEAAQKDVKTVIAGFKTVSGSQTGR